MNAIWFALCRVFACSELCLAHLQWPQQCQTAMARVSLQMLGLRRSSRLGQPTMHVAQADRTWTPCWSGVARASWFYWSGHPLVGGRQSWRPTRLRVALPGKPCAARCKWTWPARMQVGTLKSWALQFLKAGVSFNGDSQHPPWTPTTSWQLPGQPTPGAVSHTSWSTGPLQSRS